MRAIPAAANGSLTKTFLHIIVVAKKSRHKNILYAKTSDRYGSCLDLIELDMASDMKDPTRFLPSGV